MLNLYDFLTFQPETYQQMVGKEFLIVYYECPQPTPKVEVYTHYCKIDFVVSGERRLHRNGQMWISQAGHSYFVKKGAFEQQRYEEVGWHSLAVYLSDRMGLDLIREYRKFQRSKVPPGLLTDHVFDLSISNATDALARTFISAFEQETQLPPDEVENQVRAYVLSYLMNEANAPLVSYLNSLAERPKTPLFEVMDANYMFNLSLEDYARIANRSLATFKREFKTVFAVPPAKWLIEKRLNYARNLMQSSTLPVSDVAYESGFENQTHFCRVFKEKFGTSPLQYRKQGVASVAT